MEKLAMNISLFILELLWMIFVIILITYPTMLLWNCLMPTIFGLPTITFWQTLGLNLLSGLLLKPFPIKK